MDAIDLFESSHTGPVDVSGADAVVPRPKPAPTVEPADPERQGASCRPQRRVIDACLEFCFDAETGRMLMEVRSRRTGQLIIRLSRCCSRHRWPIINTHV